MGRIQFCEYTLFQQRQGVFDRREKKIVTYSDTQKGTKEGETHIIDYSDEAAVIDCIGTDAKDKLDEDMELYDIAGAEFDLDRVRDGKLTPVFFGSALTNFGVEIFLQYFLEMTTTPSSLAATQRPYNVITP